MTYETINSNYYSSYFHDISDDEMIAVSSTDHMRNTQEVRALERASSSLDQFSDNRNDNSEGEPTKPKRPLSAYNLFFQNERRKILQETPEPTHRQKPCRSHGKIGFAALARNIASKWRDLDIDGRSHYEKLASKEKEEYEEKLKVYKEMKAKYVQKETLRVLQTYKYQIPDDNTERITTMAESMTHRYGLPYLHDEFLSSSKANQSLLAVTANIGELARKLDQDSIDLILDIFHGGS